MNDSDNKQLERIIEKLEAIHACIAQHNTDIALMKQLVDSHASTVKEHSVHIDDLRQAKWKLAGAVAALSGAASFFGSKFAHWFSTPPNTGH